MNDEPQTIPGMASRLGQSLIGALPPAFLLLCIINVAFLGLVLWFLNGQIDQRTAMVSKLMDRCMQIALEHEPPPEHH
jgi:hypothetical protein